jgi:thiamine-phosphate pyrophosphorylase
MRSLAGHGLAQRLRLMVITDRRPGGDRSWLEVVDAALRGGATAVELRDKEAPSGELLEMANRLRPVADRHGALFVVNDRFDVALAAGAHGVHVGDDDIPVSAIRRVAPRGFVIGRSTDTVEGARRAEAEGASYLGVGSVFETRTKPEVAGEVIGVERLAQVAGAVSIPVIAIGGIGAENVAEVARAGAVGAAAISALMSASDPVSAAAELVRAFSAGVE